MKLLGYGEFLYAGFLYFISLVIPGGLTTAPEALVLAAFPAVIALVVFVLDPASTGGGIKLGRRRLIFEILAWTFFSESYLLWVLAIVAFKRLAPAFFSYVIAASLASYVLALLFRILGDAEERKGQVEETGPSEAD